MFDYYIPDPPLACPVCGRPLGQWQGTDGPNLLLVWKQHEPAPVDVRVMEECYGYDKAAFLQRHHSALPQRFYFSTHGCRCDRPIHAIGRCISGLWSESELMTHRNAEPYPSESEREFRARVRDLERWLAARVP